MNSDFLEITLRKVLPELYMSHGLKLSQYNDLNKGVITISKHSSIDEDINSIDIIELVCEPKVIESEDKVIDIIEERNKDLIGFNNIWKDESGKNILIESQVLFVINNDYTEAKESKLPYRHLLTIHLEEDQFLWEDFIRNSA